MIKKIKDYFIRNKSAIIKNSILYVTVLVLAIVFIVSFLPTAKQIYNERFFKRNNTALTLVVRVESIVDIYSDIDYLGDEATVYIYNCEVVEGPEEQIGHEALVIQSISVQTESKSIPASIGNLIHVNKNTNTIKNDEYNIEWEFAGSSSSFDRTLPVMILVIVFALIIIVFSRFQGINTLIALGLSLAAIFIVFIPKILQGANIYLWTMIISLYVITITLAIVIGFNKKSLCAFIGCIGGVVIIAILTLISQKIFSLTGNYDDSTYELDLILRNEYNVNINLQDLIFAAITLGSMGAILDVGISLSSSLNEIALKDASRKEIITSGFRIGRDMLGTMTNTLILAYLGGSLALVLFTILYYTLQGIISLEFISIEILQALIGTIGMLTVIPITSVVCGFIYQNDRKIMSQKKS